MRDYKREIDLGFDCKAVIYYRQPTYLERETYTIKNMINAPILLKPLAQDADEKTIKADQQLKMTALKEMLELAYNAGAEIIVKVECNEWPDFYLDLLTEGKDPKDIIVEYFSEDVIELGREIVGGQRRLTGPTDDEKIKAAKDFIGIKELEQEQIKN